LKAENDTIIFNAVGIWEYQFVLIYSPIIILKFITISLSWSSFDLMTLKSSLPLFDLLVHLAFLAYLIFTKLNLYGPVEISSGLIMKKHSKVSIDSVDWDSVNLFDTKVHLFHKGKEWSDGVKLNLKRLDPKLREKLEQLSQEFIGK
jgi:hypothetical protein